MSNFTAIYDACVLYPAPLRDLLMHLALSDLFRAKWTLDIQKEWKESLLKNRTDLSPAALDRTCQLMNENVRDCLVAGYHDLIPGLTLPDENDRHVLAAAIVCGASVIVTTNLKDFPESALSKYNIVAQHPDKFVRLLCDISIEQVCSVVKRHRAMLKNPPKTVEQYLGSLERQGLVETVAELRRCVDLI